MKHTQLANPDITAKVLNRAMAISPNINRTSLLMDLDSIPDLDMEKLLHAPELDFTHDIHGIMRHMDRSTYPGKLTDCFLPRCIKS